MTNPTHPSLRRGALSQALTGLVLATGASACAIEPGSQPTGDDTADETVNAPRTWEPIAKLVVSELHSCAIFEDGRVACLGANEEGQLGDGSNVDSLRPVFGTGLDDVMDLATGRMHTCAARIDGTVVCWGAGGRLGDGTIVSSARPVEVLGIADAVQLFAGDFHTCARRATGAVACLGDNDRGQIGDGTVGPAKLGPATTRSVAVPTV